jgi:hypothetical protein
MPYPHPCRGDVQMKMLSSLQIFMPFCSEAAFASRSINTGMTASKFSLVSVK